MQNDNDEVVEIPVIPNNQDRDEEQPRAGEDVSAAAAQQRGAGLLQQPRQASPSSPSIFHIHPGYKQVNFPDRPEKLHLTSFLSGR